MNNDPHNLTGDAAALREQLLRAANLPMAAAYAQAYTNEIIDALNRRIDARQMNQATAIVAEALTANALLAMAAEWWADAEDARTTLPNTYAVLRSFTTDLPPGIVGESYRVDEQ